MANAKISELPTASTPAGSEYLPIAQSGATKKLSVASLWAAATLDHAQVTGLGSAALQNTSAFDAAGAAAAAVAAHAALSDPHPQYLTAAEGNAAYQPLDSDLTAIAGLSTTVFGRSLLTQADAAAARSTLAAAGLADANTLTGANTFAADVSLKAGAFTGRAIVWLDSSGTPSGASLSHNPAVGNVVLESPQDLTVTAGTATFSGAVAATGTVSGSNLSALTAFTGPSGSLRTFTLPNASAAILTTNAAVAVNQGGTGAATAAGARTNLGLGTAAVADTGTGAANVPTTAQADARYQPLDSDLTAIAALATTTFGRSLLTQADAAATRTTLGVPSGTGTVSGTNTGDQDLSGYQPLDSDLTAIAALATTTFGRSLLTQADAPAARTTLGLGTLATADLVTAIGATGALTVLPVGGYPRLAFAGPTGDPDRGIVYLSADWDGGFAVSQTATGLGEWSLQMQAGGFAVRQDAYAYGSGEFTVSGYGETGVLGLAIGLTSVDYGDSTLVFEAATGFTIQFDGSNRFTVGRGGVAVSGVGVDLDVEGVVNSANLPGFVRFTGASASRTYTLPDASATVLTSNAAVTVGQGGTGAATAADARTNLGLAIGTDVQAYSANLAAIAGLTSAANRVPYFTGSGTAALATFTSFGRTLVSSADAAAGRSSLAAVGTGVANTITAPSSSSVPLTAKAAVSQTAHLVATTDSADVRQWALGAGGSAYFPTTATTLSGNATLTKTSTCVQFFNPNGSNRDVTLPGSLTSTDAGLTYWVRNTASSGTAVLVVKDSGGTQVGRDVPWGATQVVQWDGSAWQVM